MDVVEQIISELNEDSSELHHKERNVLQKIIILENMIQGADELKRILKSELDTILN